MLDFTVYLSKNITCQVVLIYASALFPNFRCLRRQMYELCYSETLLLLVLRKFAKESVNFRTPRLQLPRGLTRYQFSIYAELSRKTDVCSHGLL